MAFYKNPSICVLNRQCQSTTEENDAATFITVTCIAGTIYVHVNSIIIMMDINNCQIK